MATVPAWRWRQRSDGTDSNVTVATAPSRCPRGRQHHNCNDGNCTRSMGGWRQWQAPGDPSDDVSAATAPSWQPQQRQQRDGDDVRSDNRDDASAVTATMPKRRWQRCQHYDNAKATTEWCPSDASAAAAPMPKRRQRHDGNDAQGTLATMPAQRQRQCCDDGRTSRAATAQWLPVGCWRWRQRRGKQLHTASSGGPIRPPVAELWNFTHLWSGGGILPLELRFVGARAGQKIIRY